MSRRLLISAALTGGTFFLLATTSAQDVPIVQSQADYVTTADSAVPLSIAQQADSPDPALLESLLFQLRELQTLAADQRSIIEELSYQVQVLQQEQKERYIDLDKRIQLLQARSLAAPPDADTMPSSTAVEAAVSDETILAEYNAAKALMLEKKFDESISQLALFTKKYPQHPLTANSWYWIGEIYLVQRNSEQAESAFLRIINNYSGHDKVPDSLYKLGVIAQQAADIDTAITYFEQVLTDYPSTQSAKLAQARLNSN